jgi:hypothetical protein
MTATNHTTETRVFALSTLTTRDHAGRHFRERYDADVIEDLESAGLITINRSIHEATGLPYGPETDTVEVTEEGQELVDANPEYWDMTVRG